MKRIFASTERPRFVVYRSLRQFEAQVLGLDGKVVFGKKTKITGKKLETAGTFGEEFAGELVKLKIVTLAFDRRSYRYAGRIAAFIEGLRKGGVTI